MKTRFFSLSNGLIIAILVFITVVISSVYFYVAYDWIMRDIQEAEDLNRKVESNNEEYLKLNKMKLDIAMLVEDVESATDMYHELSEKLSSQMRMYDIDEKIENFYNKWNKVISQDIDGLENEIEFGFDEKFKIHFIDMLDAVKNLKSKEISVIKALQNNQFQLEQVDDEFKKVRKKYRIVLDLHSEKHIEHYEELTSIHHSKMILGVVGGVLFILVFGMTYYGAYYLNAPLRKLRFILHQLRDGNLPRDIEFTNYDFHQIATSLNYLVKKLSDIRNYALQVGQGNFNNQEIIEFKEEGELGTAFVLMQQSLEKVAEEDAQRTHINQGLSKFSEILGNNTNNLKLFGDEVILNLVKFLQANQGALLVVNDDNKEDEFLELVAGYAYEKKKYLNKKIVRGQGLLGQSWIERKSIYLTSVPDDYVNITSGLGYSTPRCVLIIPLIFNEVVQGVIELASFNKFKDYELGFIEKVSESISSALSSVKINTKTQQLLGQSKELTEQMKVQEEDMRLKVQELRVTQEESQRREEQYLREIRRLKKRIEEYERSF